MLRPDIYIILLTTILAYITPVQGGAQWSVDTTEEWQQTEGESEGLSFDKGLAMPDGDTGSYRSIVHTFNAKRSASSIRFKQSPVWHNWQPVSNIGPSNLEDAPVTLALGPDNYWIFGRYGDADKRSDFIAEDATLEGFDIPLKTTPFPNHFDAPAGLKEEEPGDLGYHAWQSRDMINWVHYGRVTENFSRWVTSAEYVDGKTYIYYDFPNDQDPHLYIDDNLTDGLPGTNMGLAFKDPSDGSDCAIIRDLQGRSHVIYEDWSPINASKHSWDSPLAGHAVSEDGLGNFRILSPPVDHRTTPTGETATYRHPHWAKEDPDMDSTAVYNIHTPEQDAFGDWAAISIGGQYYLFSDFHPAHEELRVAWFTSSDINEPFTLCGEIGEGHPDPDIIFAEGKFFLVTQMETDYVSPGPWVETVEARVGVDTNKDGEIDTWTEWQRVKEAYDYISGFSKQIDCTPASIDLSDLPAGFGFCFEFRTSDRTENDSKPILDSVTISFNEEK